jgi:hypothetical protein
VLQEALQLAQFGGLAAVIRPCRARSRQWVPNPAARLIQPIILQVAQAAGAFLAVGFQRVGVSLWRV